MDPVHVAIILSPFFALWWGLRFWRSDEETRHIKRQEEQRAAMRRALQHPEEDLWTDY